MGLGGNTKDQTVNLSLFAPFYFLSNYEFQLHVKSKESI